MQTSRPVVPVVDTAVLRQTLRQSTRDNADRGLNFAAKWSAELLNSLPSSSTATQQGHASTSQLGPEFAFRTSTPVKEGSGGGTGGVGGGLKPLGGGTITRKYRDSLGSVLDVSSFSPVQLMYPSLEQTMGGGDGMMIEDAMLNDHEADQYELALTYQRSHEHLRAAHTLRKCNGSKARWLRSYAKFLAGEKRAQEDDGSILSASDKGTINPFAQEVLEDMASWSDGAVERDGWLLFLKALLLLSLPPLSPSPFPSRDSRDIDDVLDLRLEAMEALVASVKLVPYNWSAWLKLATCLEGAEELEATMKFLPTVFPSLFFFVHATLEIHAAGQNLHNTLDHLDRMFPGSSTVKGMRALVHYHVREFEEATRYFAELQLSDPFRVEDIDIYSNILYVTEQRAALAKLAQEYTKMDRSRPEVCCLVGNYYSLRRDHEKAILYFRRALKLDKSYLSAWTLMGHEYVEIKNTNAAIASYRRAVDVNRKDYRAWYGLGQTYELLGEPFYALNYYQKATALRPYDARMWGALATCYEKLKRVPDAIKAYQRALVSSEAGENDLSLRIGKLYASTGQSDIAAAYHRRALSEGVKAGLGKVELSSIRIWLAKHEMREEGGDLEVAQDYLREIGSVEHKDEARSLLAKVDGMLLSRK